MEAPDYAVMLLARREYSRSELQERMQRQGYDTALTESVLSDLQARDLQSDERFAEMFVRSRIMRRHGARRIAMDLKMRGIDQYLVQQLLAASDIDWQTMACDALQAKFKTPPHDLKTRARQQRFLASRGFSGEECRYALEYAWHDED